MRAVASNRRRNRLATGSAPAAPVHFFCLADKIPRMRKSVLEQAEKLEQLRILENGHDIRVVEVAQDSVGIDTLDDLNAVEKILMRGR